VTAGRWLCHQCGNRFNVPNYFLVKAPSSLEPRDDDDDPSLPRGQVVINKCPICGSDNLAGAANPDPFTPKAVKRK